MCVLSFSTTFGSNISHSKKKLARYEYIYFFLQCHHMSLMDFVVSPPGCGRSVTDFWGLDAHEAQLRCPDEVNGDHDYEVPGWVLAEVLPNYPDHGHHGNLPFHGKISMAEPGIDFIISNQKIWPVDHGPGHTHTHTHTHTHIYIYIYIYIGRHVKYPLIMSDFN
jgi:hypothetical protein